jgi:putative membrane protein
MDWTHSFPDVEGDPMYHGYGMGGFGLLMMGGLGLFGLAILVLVAVAAWRWGRSGGPGPSTPVGPSDPTGPTRSGEGPEEILAARYARGEIDEAEYRRRLDVLRGH